MITARRAPRSRLPRKPSATKVAAAVRVRDVPVSIDDSIEIRSDVAVTAFAFWTLRPPSRYDTLVDTLKEYLLPNKLAAAKYHRASQRRRLRNKSVRSRTRNAVREAKYAIAAGELSESESLVQEALVALDRAVQGGVVHVNSAARRKSRLLRQLQRRVSGR